MPSCDNEPMRTFLPPVGLRSPHLQTLLARVRTKASQRHGTDACSEDAVLDCRDGIRLKAMVTPGPTDTPLIIILHGWLGDTRSWYVERTAGALRAGGFRVACLLLRDHGGTAALNREMFNSARLGEVVDACNSLAEGCDLVGIVGFSLGGNFALRLASDPGIDSRLVACLAVSPVIDPARTVRAIDAGWLIYRKWFVNKWHRALREKQVAFPNDYRELDGALRLSTVAGITDFLIGRYLPYRDSADYYARYDLRGEALARVRIDTRIVAAMDDMIIPGDSYAEVAHNDRVDIQLFDHGGHCGFVDDWRLNAYLDDVAVEYFRQRMNG